MGDSPQNYKETLTNNNIQ